MCLLYASELIPTAMIGRAGSSPALGSFVVAVVLLFSSAAAFETLDLNGADWRVTNKNGSVEITSVRLPSYPIEELRKLGLVQDPQYRCERIACASSSAQCCWVMLTHAPPLQVWGAGDPLGRPGHLDVCSFVFGSASGVQQAAGAAGAQWH